MRLSRPATVEARDDHRDMCSDQCPWIRIDPVAVGMLASIAATCAFDGEALVAGLPSWLRTAACTKNARRMGRP